MSQVTAAPALTRRRTLTIVAAAAGAALWPGPARSGGPRRFEWTGGALGTHARIVLHHHERAVAPNAVRTCLAEIARLEREFSLYRADSALSRLNRDGQLEAPSQDMRRLLADCLRFGELTRGAFDVSVQPLWRLIAEHFAAHPGATGEPPPAALAAARAVVDYRKIALGPARVTLGPGMALTLNGIAQGYITDRVAEILRVRGWTNVLIDLGEIRVLDGRPGGGPWTVGLQNTGRRLPLDNRALATSSGEASRFEASGRHHHLLDPGSGASPNAYRSVTVIAPEATTADALSTALFLMPRAEAAQVLRAGVGAEAWLIDKHGREAHLKA
jgi:thiamine biosynthesis lipoprotein